MSVRSIVNQSPPAMQTINGDTGNQSWSDMSTLAIDIDITDKQGTSPTVQFFLDRLGADGTTNFNIWASSVQSVSGASPGTPILISTSAGPGCIINQEIGSSGRLRWMIGGTATPGAKFSVSIIGKN